MELPSVSRHDAGTYVCSASNGVGKTAKAEIDVEITCKYIHLVWFTQYANCLLELLTLRIMSVISLRIATVARLGIIQRHRLARPSWQLPLRPEKIVK